MIEAYPLQWPVGYPRTVMTEISRFGDHSLSKAVSCVNSELQSMGAKNVVISSNIPVRKDGLPRSDYSKRSINDVGVAIYFLYKNEQKVLCCDAWRCVEDNIWAIVKSVEAMRGLGRWKVSQIIEQTFHGFKALPEKATGKSCWDILGMVPTRDVHAISKKYKELAIKMHPDTGGSAEAFAELSKAREDAVQYAQNIDKR